MPSRTFPCLGALGDGTLSTGLGDKEEEAGRPWLELTWAPGDARGGLPEPPRAAGRLSSEAQEGVHDDTARGAG